MATFMVGQNLSVVALFDSDYEGRSQEPKLRTKWITRYKESRSKSLLLGDAIGVTGDLEIEDMFPEAYYHVKANEAHKDKLAKSHQSAIPLVGTGPIVDRLTSGANQIGIQFNKGSVAKLIRRDVSKMHDLSGLDPQTVEKFEKLFGSIATAFSDQ
jgi:hypothetical protein